MPGGKAKCSTYQCALLVLCGGLILLLIVMAVHHGWSGGTKRAALVAADPDAILTDPSLVATAITLGAPVFREHCQSCHGPAGEADRTRGIPDLTDQDFLYGEGHVSEIEQIVRHGIRAGDPEGWNAADMPAYATLRPYAREPIPPLAARQIDDVVAYLRTFAGDDPDPLASERGRAIFAGNGACWDCHSEDVSGDAAIGAPNLSDEIWLYGDGSRASIRRSVAHGHAGISPAFGRLLSPLETRAVSVFVASLPSKHARKG